MSTGRILLADDDADIRELIAFKLTQAGYEVITAEDGVEALATARASAFDLAVFDVMMPSLSGIDVCRQLRLDPSTASLPVILLTSKSQDGDVEVGFAAGADDYVTKPFSPRELTTRIIALLSRTTA